MYVDVSAFLIAAVTKRMNKKAMSETVDDNDEVSQTSLRSILYVA